MDRKKEEIKRISSNSKGIFILSEVLALLVIIQSIGGLFLNWLYRDNLWVTSIFKGTDFVTIMIVIPVLIGSAILIRKNSFRAKLLLAGTVYYIFYNNMYYLFSAFNYFFLIYVSIFIVSLGLLITLLLSIEREMKIGFRSELQRKAISVGMFVCAAILIVMWIGQALVFIMNGQTPQLIIDSGGITHMVAALDLTLEAPVLIVGSVLLLRSRAWGIIISSGILIQCIYITINLLITPIFQESAGIKDAWMMVPLWIFMFAVFVFSTISIFKNMQIEAPIIKSHM